MVAAKRHGHRNIAQRQRDWGPSWKLMKLITNTDQTTASTIHQLRPGQALPDTPSTIRLHTMPVSGAYSWVVDQLYQDKRRQAGITRETTLRSPPFTPKGAKMLQGFIQTTGVATRG